MSQPDDTANLSNRHNAPLMAGKELDVTPLRADNAVGQDDLISGPLSGGERIILGEEAFKRSIAVERKRTERSKEPFLLMLLETNDQPSSVKRGQSMEKVISALVPTTRETDVIGWYKARSTIGIIFTGLLSSGKSAAVGAILARISGAFREELPFEQFGQISISFHLFPDDWDQDDPGEPRNPAIYPDIGTPEPGKRTLLGVKRTMDIIVSLLLILLLLPSFLVIAILIKATSRGPIFFRQQRVGQYGQRFMFLKFRSMKVNNDHSVHKEYVKQLIAGCAEKVSANGNGEGVYKLANDRRITSIGKFLRRTSLDEIPQFINVLRGEMSLVGPRPPIPYELVAYQTWHRRRLLHVKPGITGLWQVTGRSKVTFDDMVRLDLRYAASWSPWLDLKILMRTPAAVVKGAY